MNIIIEKNDFNPNYVFFQNSVKNIIMHDGNFTRIIYSNSLFILNSIIFTIDLHITHFEKYFNKYKYFFNCQYENTKREIEKIAIIEKQILDRIQFAGKTPIYKITQQLSYGNIKFYTDTILDNEYQNIYIKLSGIWETEHEYGISFKFIDSNRFNDNTIHSGATPNTSNKYHYDRFL
jgi:hypothetical protein